MEIGRSYPSPQTNKETCTKRIFKIEIDNFNQITNKAIQVLQLTPKDQPSSNNSFFKQKQFLKFSATAKIKNGLYFSSSLPPKGMEKIQLQIKANKLHQHVSKKNEIEQYHFIKSRNQRKQGSNKLKESDLRFSLHNLAFLVKSYMEVHGISLAGDIYFQIMGKHLKQNGSNINNLQMFMSKVKRRICEVLRVLEGIGAITIYKRSVSLTDLGALKGRGLSRSIKRQKREYEERKKHYLSLVEKRNSLLQLLNDCEEIRVRNQKQILSSYSSSKTNDLVITTSFNLPLSIISGPPRPVFTFFKRVDFNDIHSVQRDKFTGRISIKGDNLSIIPLQKVLRLVCESLVQQA